MANTLTAVVPQLLAQGLMALRGACVMPLLVNRQYESMAGERGSTIDIPIPSAIEAQEVAPANVPPSTAGIAPTSVPLVLDQWFEAPFYLTDKERLEVMSGTLPMQASEAVKSLARNVNGYIFGLYKGVYGYYGTAGTTPFGEGAGVSDATGVRKILNNQLAPLDSRRLVLDPDAEAAALSLRAFHDMSFSGRTDAIISGQIEERFGFSWFMDQQAPTHEAGTITTGLATKAATEQDVGTTSLVCTTAADTGKCALKAGDIIAIAGHDQTYVLMEDATQATAATDVTLEISPGLQVDIAGGEAVTVKDSHAVNLAFHRDAFAFATRPLVRSDHPAVITESITDQVSGLTLRLEVTHEHKRLRFSYDILYGAALVRPELAARLAG